jgi:2-polyprenyl-6-methoxyphenol hydroxylase-like FAD-dependent oxidoreductase
LVPQLSTAQPIGNSKHKNWVDACSRVLIIGAGIGGLTTAIGIDRSGIEAVVLEQAPELREIGSAISLWPNALKALAHFGITDTVRRLAIEEGSGCLRSWRGTILSQIDLRELGRQQ